MPQGGSGGLSPWSAFTADNGPWTANPFPGRHFTPATGPSSAWYSIAGCRDWGTGTPVVSSGSTYFWQTSMTPAGIVYIFQFNDKAVQPANSGGNHRAYGFSVRCIRE